MKAFFHLLGAGRIAALICCGVLAVAALFLKFAVPGYSFSALVCLCLIGIILFYTLFPLVGLKFPAFAKAVQTAVTVILAVGVLVVGITEGIIIHASFGNPEEPVDYVVVLGAKVNRDVHPVSFMLALKDNKWDSLTAMTSGGKEKNLVHEQMEGEDWAGAFMRFDDGTYATLEANYITVGGMEDVLDIYCEQGCIHVDLSFSGPVKVFSIPGLDYTVEKAEITTGWSTPAVDEKYSLGYCGEIAHFVESALAGRDAQVGLRGVDGLETLKVINLIYRSAREGIQIRNPRKEG